MKYKISLEICEIEKKNYHVFVSLKIGEKPCRLLLDTGASKTVFDKEKVLQYITSKQLKSNEGKSVGLGVSEMETQEAVVKCLQFNKLTIKKLRVAVLEIGHVNLIYKNLELPEIDGVLGSDFLMKYKAVIDYRKQILKLSTDR
ncbi:MAG: clan AA aspartic protease [Bacteroidetes bacterium]|nr:MAG: clan AA aspartic protease [Bacteroidota bacterium]